VSTTLDLSITPTLKRIQAIIRHQRTSGTPAFFDDITLERVSGPPASTYEVNMYSVKTDGTTAEHTASTVSSSAAQLSGLRTSTTYVWRVRGMTETGTGYANAHVDTTITATSLDLPRDRLTNGATSTQQIDWRVRAQHDWGQGVEGATWTLSVEPATPRRYYVTDHLGSTRAVVNPAKPAGSEVVEMNSSAGR
jgi:hypothetical protein